MKLMLSYAVILAVTPAMSRAEQHPLAISPGAKVQVFAAKGALGYTSRGDPRRSISGVVEAITPERLTIRDDGVLRTLPLRDVSRLNVAKGKKRHAANVIGGAVAGALFVGLGLTYLATGCDCEAGEVAPTVVLGAASAAAVGGGIGALVKTDRWEAVPLPLVTSPTAGAVRLSIRGVPRGAMVGVTLAF